MEEEGMSTLTLLPPLDVDLDLRFSSTASTSTTFASSSSSSSSSSCLLLLLPSSARSSLSLPPSLPSPPLIPIPTPAPPSTPARPPSAVLPVSPPTAPYAFATSSCSANLARVFHYRLRDFDAADFALMVVDLDALDALDTLDAKPDLDQSDTLWHVRTKGHVLSSLDYPFLPTLYACLDACHYSFLIDYCPGGDLLSRRPARRLPPVAAEVLLVLEYLHALGFVYGNLKP